MASGCFTKHWTCTILFSLFVLAGCASGPKNIEITGTADAVVNRDASGRSLSVVVHIYQLKEQGEFSKLTFDTLTTGRTVSELIGKDLLDVTEVMLVPGSTQTSTSKISPDARHIGIVAFFRQPDQHYWRLLIDADQVRSGGINFLVQDCFLTLMRPKANLIPGQPASPPSSCGGSGTWPPSSASLPSGTGPTSSAAPSQGRRSNALETARQRPEALPTKQP